MFKISGDLLLYLQIIVSVLLVVLIILQQRGSGLSSTFGGESAGFLSYRSRRGFEKLIFILTIVTAAAFLVISFLLAAA